MQKTMPGARWRGRPRTAWIDNINTWTGLSVEESVRMSEDRDKWRKYVYGVANPWIEDGWRTEQIEWTRLWISCLQFQRSSSATAAADNSEPDNTEPHTTATTEVWLHFWHFTAHCWRTYVHENLRVWCFLNIFSISWTALWLNWMYSMLISDLSLLHCSSFICHAVLLASVQSSWPHYEVDQITNVDKLASSAGK